MDAIYSLMKALLYSGMFVVGFTVVGTLMAMLFSWLFFDRED